jgi:hypothetical protein
LKIRNDISDILRKASLKDEALLLIAKYINRYNRSSTTNVIELNENILKIYRYNSYTSRWCRIKNYEINLEVLIRDISIEKLTYDSQL